MCKVSGPDAPLRDLANFLLPAPRATGDGNRRFSPMDDAGPRTATYGHPSRRAPMHFDDFFLTANGSTPSDVKLVAKKRAPIGRVQ